ncbi:SulP family inorganic anion transporter [Melittangium boletus]|uniref:Sodium-independent anion transporter n=1 Tax=Melittangium boletus DSM 14713 TaxID=1294270 RepID=A0A250IQK5_9BACT|nr:SulP family inorganic anion transporter [Melittangium boletus]ATB34035.1 sodium-independent anion transporter [Melittangium boletus DSM 14713]
MKTTAYVAQLKQEWFSNIRGDLMSGTVVALALIPEAIAFSIIAGVDPKVGLYASFIIAVMTAFFGGRPGMISAATGAMALLMVTLVANHGLEYLFAATILTGVLQLVFRALRLSRYMKFVPRPVMTGFVNALAILIFMAQLPQFTGASWQMYAMVAAGLAIIYGLPRLTKAVPSPLVAIVVLTAVSISTGISVRTVGDMGALPTSLPFFHLPQVPFTLETLRIILPYAVPLTFVGLLESLLTAAVVDEMTDSPSCKHSEAFGQGIANIVTGFFGGMAGCAMIGQSVINVSSGGRGRLSTFFAGIFLLFLILVLGDWVARIPMGALVAVMIMVSIGTFDWKSLGAMRVLPGSESVVMVATVLTVVLTHDLAKGVLVGVVLSAIFFARTVAKLVSVKSSLSEDGQRRRYDVMGEIFFVSVERFIASFDFREHVTRVEIDLTHSHVWDASAVAAIDRIVLKFRSRGVEVMLIGLNEASATLIGRLGTHDKPGAVLTPGH